MSDSETGDIASGSRRAFVTKAATTLAAFAVPLSSTTAAATTPEPWLEGLHGAHRQFFDVGTLQGGGPIRRVKNFIDTYAESYGLRDADVNALFGAHGPGLGFVLGDAIWAKYELGKRFDVIDPATKQPSRRNVFFAGTHAATGTSESLKYLMSRGVRVLACNNSVKSLSASLAAQSGEAPADVAAALVAGMVAGTFVVPAMLIAGNRAQEVGFTYAFLA